MEKGGLGKVLLFRCISSYGFESFSPFFWRLCFPFVPLYLVLRVLVFQPVLLASLTLFSRQHLVSGRPVYQLDVACGVSDCNLSRDLCLKSCSLLSRSFLLPWLPHILSLLTSMLLFFLLASRLFVNRISLSSHVSFSRFCCLRSLISFTCCFQWPACRQLFARQTCM